jgi:hypothetical protein
LIACAIRAADRLASIAFDGLSVSEVTRAVRRLKLGIICHFKLPSYLWGTTWLLGYRAEWALASVLDRSLRKATWTYANMTTHDVQGAASASVVVANLRCPHCNHQSAFHGFGNINDITWTERSSPTGAVAYF